MTCAAPVMRRTRDAEADRRNAITKAGGAEAASSKAFVEVRLMEKMPQSTENSMIMQASLVKESKPWRGETTLPAVYE